MSKTILIAGASSGFGEMTAYALADAGYTVFASISDTAGRNAPKVAQALDYSRKNRIDLRSVELDVTNQNSVDHAVAEIIRQVGCIDVLIHNADHMVLGPAEAFTPSQFAQQYDINVVGAQRVNRTAGTRRTLKKPVSRSSTRKHHGDNQRVEIRLGWFHSASVGRRRARTATPPFRAKRCACGAIWG